MVFLRASIGYTHLRGERRFQELLRKMKLDK